MFLWGSIAVSNYIKNETMKSQMVGNMLRAVKFIMKIFLVLTGRMETILN